MTQNNGADPASRRRVIAGLTVGFAMVGTRSVRADPASGITHNVDAIHQEVVFKAPPSRVYEVLTDEREFQKVIVLSGAAKSGKINPTLPAQIGREAGAPFAIFGGFVVGRNIELVPDTRLVQAWRPQNWPAGVYSLVKFELLAQGTETLLTFDQSGFPVSDAETLALGWNMNYWQPMAAVLAHS